MLWVFSALFTFKLFAQTFKGRVVDGETRKPIVGAVIQFPDSSIITTNSSGEFVSPSKEVTISHVGFNTVVYQLDVDRESTIVLRVNPFVLQGITVQSAVKSEEYQRYPGGLGLLSTDVLKTSDNSIITEALNSIPGAYMHSGAYNINRVTIRGIGSRTPFSTNKIRAYFGDIPLTDGGGETAIEDLDMAGLGEVVVFKGPNSSLYGSGLGGVIQMKPRHIELGRNAIFGELTRGSYGLLRGNVGWQHHGEKSKLIGGYFHQSSDGYRDNNKFERDAIQIAGSFYGKKSILRGIAYYVSQFAGIPSSINEEDFRNDPTKAAFTWNAAQGFEEYEKLLLGLTYEKVLKPGFSWRTSIYGNHRDAYEPRPFNILSESTTGVGVRSIVEGELAGRGFVIGGIEVFGDRYDRRTFVNRYQDFPGEGSVKGNLTSSFREHRKFYTLFAEIEYPLNEKLKLVMGTSLNQTFYDLDDKFNTDSLDQSGVYTFDGVFSPRLAFTYDFNKWHSVFLSGSRGFSPPTLEETLTPGGAINPYIKPETGWSFEAGLKGSTADSRIAYDVSLYTMHIRNLLVSRRLADDQYVGVNAGSTLHQGLEINLKSRLVNSRNFTLDLRNMSAFNRFEFREFVEELDGNVNDFSGQQLTGVPQTSNVTRFDLKWKRVFYAQAEWRFTGKMPITDSNEIFADSYQIVNAMIGLLPSITKKISVDISYRVANLFDRQYASMLAINASSFGGNAPRYYYPGLPTNHQISLKLKVDWPKIEFER